MPTIIMPAGGSKIEWAPAPKEAGTEEIKVKSAKSDQDMQFKAIRNLPGIKAQAEILDLEEVEEDEDGGGEDEGGEDSLAIGIAEDAPCTTEEDEKEGVDAVVEAAEEAAEAAQKVVEVAQQAAGCVEEEAKGEDGDGEASVEIAIIDDEIPGLLPDGDGEVKKEGIDSFAKDNCKSKSKKKGEEDEEEDEMKSKASSGEKFVKISALSPQNKKDLVSYWRDMLGFPPEYVKAMVQDYEE